MGGVRLPLWPGAECRVRTHTKMSCWWRLVRVKLHAVKYRSKVVFRFRFKFLENGVGDASYHGLDQHPNIVDDNVMGRVPL
jgi:hypothetical protein